MKIAIVILNWNGENYLQRFLPVLLENTSQNYAGIFVADNASTDNSLSVLKENFPTVQVIQLDQNYGFAGGYNMALAQIQAEYYVLLNSDIEVSKNWLEPLVDYMDHHIDVAACQPKILSYNDPLKFEHAGAAGGFIDKYGYPFCRGRVIGSTETDYGQYDSISDIFWATGACLLIRSEVYHKVGGLDDDFFAHMEEIDMCWRIKNRGYRIVCLPQSFVFHIGGGTLDTENPFKTYLNFRNNLYMLYKNLPATTLSQTMFRRKIFDYVAAIQFYITGKPENAKSVFKARTDFKKKLPGLNLKRAENLMATSVEQHPEILQKSIVLNYFLKGRKTYNSLVQK